MSPKLIFWSNAIILDNFIKKVDFIKIDADGAEPHILKGMSEIIKNNKNLKMVIEYYPRYISKKGGKPHEVLEILEKDFNIKVIPHDYGKDHWNFICTHK